MESFILALLKVTNLCHCCIIVSQLPKVVLTMPANFHYADSERTPPLTSISFLLCGGVVTMEVRQSWNQVYKTVGEGHIGSSKNKWRTKERHSVKEPMYVHWKLNIWRGNIQIVLISKSEKLEWEAWNQSLIGLVLTPAENINSLVAVKCHPLERKG